MLVTTQGWRMGHHTALCLQLPLQAPEVGKEGHAPLSSEHPVCSFWAQSKLCACFFSIIPPDRREN